MKLLSDHDYAQIELVRDRLFNGRVKSGDDLRDLAERLRLALENAIDETDITPGTSTWVETEADHD
jgi:hypothetical protein